MQIMKFCDHKKVLNDCGIITTFYLQQQRSKTQFQLLFCCFLSRLCDMWRREFELKSKSWVVSAEWKMTPPDINARFNFWRLFWWFLHDLMWCRTPLVNWERILTVLITKQLHTCSLNLKLILGFLRKKEFESTNVPWKCNLDKFWTWLSLMAELKREKLKRNVFFN